MYDYLDLRQTKRLKELVPYKVLAPDADEIIKELDRLNNIIDGLEKFFKYAYDNEVKPLNDRKISVWTICLDKLKELKGGEK